MESLSSIDQPPVDEIDRRRREVVDKFYEFKTSLHSRKNKLESTKQFIQFKRQVDELATWVNDKFLILKEQSFHDTTNLSTKRQKLQTFEVEINAHQEVLAKLLTFHNSMKDDPFYMSDKAFECYKDVEQQYSELRSACAQKKAELEILCERIQYVGEANEMLQAISIKLEEAESTNYGNNMVEVTELQNIFKTFSKLLSADEARWESLIQIGKKLLSNKHKDSDEIRNILDELSLSWDKLEKATENRRTKLDAAHEVFLFVDQTQETQSWISDKLIALSIEDTGKDLASADALVRHHSVLVRDLVAIEERIRALDVEANDLIVKFSTYHDIIVEAQAELVSCWEGLRKSSVERGNNLSYSQKLHRFLRDSSDLINWIHDMRNLTGEDSEPETLPDSEALLERMQEYEGEFSSRKEILKSTLQFGNSLLTGNNLNNSLIQSTIDELETNIDSLRSNLKVAKSKLELSIELMKFLRCCNRVQCSFTHLLNEINCEVFGDTWEETDELIKCLENIERTYRAYCDNFADLQHEATRLLQIHPLNTQIEVNISNLDKLKAKVDSLIGTYRDRLLLIQGLQEFFCELLEIRGWVQERSLDLTQDFIGSIEQALQSQEILENEININTDRITRFLQKGENIQYPPNYQNKHVIQGIVEISNEWNSLKQLCLEKRNKLTGDLTFMKLSFEIDKILSWLISTQTLCESQDLGKDFNSASQIQKAFLLLDHQLESQKNKFGVVAKKVDDTRDDKNSNSDVLIEKVSELELKFDTFLPIYQKRITDVDSSCFCFNFILKIMDEQDWIDEKSILIHSCSTCNDLIRAQKVFKKFELLFADFNSREKRILSLQEDYQRNVSIVTVASIEKDVDDLSMNFNQLKRFSTERRDILLQNIALQHYFSNCMEAFSWVKEKETLILGQSLGKDEESVALLITKQEAIISDITHFSISISDLRKCADGLIFPIEVSRDSSPKLSHIESTHTEYVLCKYNYTARRSQELSMQKGQIAVLLSSSNNDWWKVEITPGNKVGYVPANYLQHTSSTNDSNVSTSNPTLNQKELELFYQKILNDSKERLVKLNELYQQFSLEREINELMLWIQEARAIGATIDKYSTEIEFSERMKGNFEELLTQVWAFEPRILRIAELKESSTFYAVLKPNIDTLIFEWEQLLNGMELRKQSVFDLLYVQKSLHNFDEIISWIVDIDSTICSENQGKDLSSVQLLLREHEMVENTHLAIKNKIDALQTVTLSSSPVLSTPSNLLPERQTELTKVYDTFCKNLSQRSSYLEASHYYQRFLTEQRDLISWTASIMSQITLGEFSQEISGVEALLMRIEELNIETDARENIVKSLDVFGKELIEKDVSTSQEVSARLDELNSKWVLLKTSCASRESKLNQCFNLLLFLRDVDNIDNWISLKRSYLSSIEVTVLSHGVGIIMRNLAEFTDCLNTEEAKINRLQESTNTLINSRHYASAEIAEKRSDILQKWNALKSLLAAKIEEVESTFSLQQFFLDASEIESWISEKMNSCGDLSFKTAPYNSLDQYCQKQRALEAEVAAHEDRIRGLLNNGQRIIDSELSQELSQPVSLKLRSLEDDWHLLLSTFEEKSIELTEAKDEIEFSRNFRSFILWIEETKSLLESEEQGSDVEHSETISLSLNLIKVELETRKNQIADLSKVADKLLLRRHTNVDLISDMKSSMISRFDDLSNLCVQRELITDERLKILRYINSLDQEESWFKEKILLTGVEDYGKDLIGVQRLLKKHQRFETEFQSHEVRIARLLQFGESLSHSRTDENLQSEICQKSENIKLLLGELKSKSVNRDVLLHDSEAFQQFSANTSEEDSWLMEKLASLETAVADESIEVIQQRLSRLEAFNSDLQGHQRWIHELILTGSKLIENGNLHSEAIKQKSQSVTSKLQDLENRSSAAKERNIMSKIYLQFSHRMDLVELWIAQKEIDVRSLDFGEGNFISYIEGLISMHETLENSLQMFQLDGINPLLLEKDSLTSSGNSQAKAVETRFQSIHSRWNVLREGADVRKSRLKRSLELSNKVDELFLSFAKKASAFYNWFESAEEDLIEPVTCSSIEEIKQLNSNHVQFQTSLSWAHSELKQLLALDRQIKSLTSLTNPYTWYTNDSLQEAWNNLQSSLNERQSNLNNEQNRQEANDKLKRLFAEKANAFNSWLVNTRKVMVESTGQLQEQLDFLQNKFENITQKQQSLSEIEKLASELQNEMILDNSYTEHSPVTLTQQWDQLSQLGRRMIHNLQQQIFARNTTGVSEEDMKDFQTLFNVYDKDRSGQLEENEFKSCLISLGYSLQFLEKDQKDSEYESILDQVDPKRLGYVTLEEFMSFHISRRTEKVNSREELEEAFRAITSDGDKSYVTKDELNQALGIELQEFCSQHMNQIRGGSSSCLDYMSFTRSLFMS